MNNLILCTLLTRTDADGDAFACDVVINFSVESVVRGCAARIYGDPADCWPAEADEYEFSFDGAEFDGGEPADAPGPMTAAETATLRAWFDAHHSEACDAAADAA